MAEDKTIFDNPPPVESEPEDSVVDSTPISGRVDDTAPQEQEELLSEDEFDLDRLMAGYKDHNYLLLGGSEYASFLKPDATLTYLRSCGFGESALTRARKHTTLAQQRHARVSINHENAQYCDFCGAKLGAEYDLLSDGRERCYRCSKTRVKTLEEYEQIFVEVIKNMEALFGIHFFTNIDIRIMSAKKLAKKLGIRYEPTPQYNGRVLGFAENKKERYLICVENQSPYLNAVAAFAHELTHIWQYINWEESFVKRKYYAPWLLQFPGISPRKILYEGMAKWVEIQYLFLINEKDRAYLEIAATLGRNDEYAIGLALFMDEYEFSRNTFIDKTTPFERKDNPL